MTHRLATNYAKNYCNRTLIVKVIVENVVTCFLGHGVEPHAGRSRRAAPRRAAGLWRCRRRRSFTSAPPVFSQNVGSDCNFSGRLRETINQ